MSYAIAEAVTVSMSHEGEDLSGTYGPGVVELPDVLGELLVAQGQATVSTEAAVKPAPKPRKPKTPKPNPVVEATPEDLPTEPAPDVAVADPVADPNSPDANPADQGTEDK